MENFSDLYNKAFHTSKEFFKDDELYHTHHYVDFFKNTETEIVNVFNKLNKTSDSLESRLFYYSIYKLLNIYSELIPNSSSSFINGLFNVVFPEWETEYGGKWTDEMLTESYALRMLKMYKCDKKPLKAFISLPFTGKEDTLYQRFEDTKLFAVNNLTSDDVYVEIIAQDNIDELIEKKCSSDNYPYEMGKDIEKVLKSDVVVFGEGWENSKGCQLEHKAAELFGIKIIYIENED